MSPRTSLHPVARPSLAASPLVRSGAVQERPGWRRVEIALAIACMSGVVAATIASWIVALAMRDVLASLPVDATSAGVSSMFTAIARIGVVVAEALSALSVSVATGFLLLRSEVRPSTREMIRFWGRVLALLRAVGAGIVFVAAWKLCWSALLESRAPWLLVAFAIVQIVALAFTCVRPRPDDEASRAARVDNARPSRVVSPRSSSPSTPAPASGKESR